jgi:hypothetical protein
MRTPDPAKAGEFQSRQAPLMEALYREMCASVPSDWDLVVLEVDVKHALPGRGTEYTFRLYNPASRRVLNDMPPAVARAAASVHLWLRGTFTVVRRDRSQIAMTLAHFDYSPLS